jgi:hypothetical protein
MPPIVHLPTAIQLRNIIAEDIGCPSLVSGEEPSFKYCCDLKPGRPCYCEQAANHIIESIQSLTPSDIAKEPA